MSSPVGTLTRSPPALYTRLISLPERPLPRPGPATRGTAGGGPAPPRVLRGLGCWTFTTPYTHLRAPYKSSGVLSICLDVGFSNINDQDSISAGRVPKQLEQIALRVATQSFFIDKKS